MERVAAILRQLYELVDELERLHKGRSFTPDGHMVGSIGEAWAMWMYDLVLLPASAPIHDATTQDGRYVQIKATQRTSVGIYGEPKHLIVLKLHRTGIAEEVFNGPGEVAWNAAGKPGKHSQRPITVTRLRRLMDSVPASERLPIVRTPNAVVP